MPQFELSEKSIDDLIAYLNNFKKDTKRMGREITTQSLRALKSRAYKNIKDTVGHTPYIPTGELASSLHTERIDNYHGVIANVHPNSAAVEFGTGIVGANSPHPLSSEKSYQYDENNHGKNGWMYKDKNGEKHFTRGEVAHRFMYDAMIDFKNSGDIEKIGIAAFNKIFGGKK